MTFPILRVAVAAAMLAGCQAAPPPEEQIWLRTDGQSMRANPALAQQFDIDRTICLGETQRAGISAPPIYTDSFIEAAMVSASRDRQMVDVAMGCMAGRGYLLVPASQVETRAAQLRAAAASGAVGTKPSGI